MSIVVMGAVFVDIKGYPLSSYIPGGRNAGRVVQVLSLIHISTACTENSRG